MAWDQAVPSKQAEAGQRKSSPAMNHFQASNDLPLWMLRAQAWGPSCWSGNPGSFSHRLCLSSPISTVRIPVLSPHGLPSDTVVKNPPANARDPCSIPGSGRCPGEGNGYPLPLQDSCLGNPLDRGAWQAAAHGVAKSWT